MRKGMIQGHTKGACRSGRSTRVGTESTNYGVYRRHDLPVEIYVCSVLGRLCIRRTSVAVGGATWEAQGVHFLRQGIVCEVPLVPGDGGSQVETPLLGTGEVTHPSEGRHVPPDALRVSPT